MLTSQYCCEDYMHRDSVNGLVRGLAPGGSDYGESVLLLSLAASQCLILYLIWRGKLKQS